MSRFNSPLHEKYTGLSGIFDLYDCWKTFSLRDYERYMKMNNYLNDVLAMNIYGFSEEKVKSVAVAGIRVMEKLLKKYGVPEAEFSAENIKRMANWEYEYGAAIFEQASDELMGKILAEVAKRMIVEKEIKSGAATN
ncbi:MAG: hypothetical protein V1648_05400 [Candidatus Aenigmatarchaeota archaeon]